VSESSGADLARVDALLELGRYDDAVTALRRLLSADASLAGSSDSWCRLSLAYLRLDRFGDSLDAAGRAAALAPDNEWSHRLASHALESLGRGPEAVGAAAECVRLAPHQWQGHARLAASLSASGGDLVLARQAAGQAVALAPYEPDAHSAMGLVALRQGDNATAERAFRHVLSLQPDHHSALNNLAVIQLRQRNLDEALSGFSAAVRSEPGQEVAKRNIRIVVQAVVYRAQWFVFIAAWVTRQLVAKDGVAGSPGGVGRPVRVLVVGVIALAAVAGVLWSLRRIPLALRPYARSVLRRSKLLLVSAVVTVAALGTLLAVVVPADGRTASGVSAAAAGVALVGLLLSVLARSSRRGWQPPFGLGRRPRK
jgi:Flp pilus assembly protein TadD